jgi:hypothetical protein
VRVIFLAASATTLLAVGTALSFQAGRSPGVDVPVLSDAVAAPQSAPDPNIEAVGGAAAAGPVQAEQATAAPVIRVRSIRVEPERPPLTADVAPQPAAADSDQQQSAAVQPAPAPVLKSPVLPARRAGTIHAKRAVAVANRSAHPRRKLRLASADRAGAGDELPAAPVKPGPESLNPLGKLLTQGNP